MSWLARSVADTLRIDDDDEDEDEQGYEEINLNPNPKSDEHKELEEQPQREDEEDGEEDRSDNQGRGVKEDLSEFRETLTRQLWGVASFLAPAPPSPSARSVSDLNRPESSGQSDSGCISDQDTSDFAEGSGDRNHFSEASPTGMLNPLNGNFEKSIDSSFEMEDPIGDAVGITDEVLAFASNIAHHPETWLDFPLSEDEDMDGIWLFSAAHYCTVCTFNLFC